MQQENSVWRRLVVGNQQVQDSQLLEKVLLRSQMAEFVVVVEAMFLRVQGIRVHRARLTSVV